MTENSNLDTWNERSAWAYFSGNQKAALEMRPTLGELLASHPDDPRAIEALLRCHLYQAVCTADAKPDELAEAQALLEQYERLCPESATTAAFRITSAAGELRLAETYLQKRQWYDLALGLLNEALANHPDNIEILVVAAQLYLHLPEQYGGGISVARPFIEKASQDDKYGSALRELIAERYTDGQ